MNREIYMKSLGDRLRKLPKEDYDMAMEYFREYFEEAGPEKEAQAIEDLGTPKQAAEQIIMNMAVENSEKVQKKEGKRNFSAVWVGILAVFAAPIALPIALAVVGVVGSLGIALVSVLAALVLSGICMAAGGAAAVVLAAFLIFRAPADAISTIGAGFLCTGLGLLICPCAIALTRGTLRLITRIFGKIVEKFTKGGKNHEQEK